MKATVNSFLRKLETVMFYITTLSICIVAGSFLYQEMPYFQYEQASKKATVEAITSAWPIVFLVTLAYLIIKRQRANSERNNQIVAHMSPQAQEEISNQKENIRILLATIIGALITGIASFGFPREIKDSICLGFPNANDVRFLGALSVIVGGISVIMVIYYKMRIDRKIRIFESID